MGWKTIFRGLSGIALGLGQNINGSISSQDNDLKRLHRDKIECLINWYDTGCNSDIPLMRAFKRIHNSLLVDNRSNPYKIEYGTYNYSNFGRSIVNYQVLLWLVLSDYETKLIKKYNQLCYTDSYGDIALDSWIIEKDKFIKKRVTNCCLGLYEQIPENIINIVNDNLDLVNDDSITDALDDAINFILDNATPDYNDSENSLTDDFNEYELLVAEYFNQAGWEATTTPKGADQGADVLASSPNNLDAVVQCKLYSSPVGNKAVQEVLAAKVYYDAQLAIVVSNQQYTRSAMQLADSSDVILLHHDDIALFTETINNL